MAKTKQIKRLKTPSSEAEKERMRQIYLKYKPHLNSVRQKIFTDFFLNRKSITKTAKELKISRQRVYKIKQDVIDFISLSEADFKDIDSAMKRTFSKGWYRTKVKKGYRYHLEKSSKLVDLTINARIPLEKRDIVIDKIKKLVNNIITRHSY